MPTTGEGESSGTGASTTEDALGSTRRWRYGELTRDDVVQAGLRITRRDGFSKLSMRNLAAELGSPSMNAYYYVRDKRALLDLIADGVLGDVALPPGELPWDRRLTMLFESGREVLLRYPGVAEHLLRRTLGLPNEVRLYRAGTDILIAAGFERSVSDRTQRVMAYLLFGAVTSELASPSVEGDANALVFPDDPNVFRWGLELLLAGLRAHEAP